MGKTKYPDLASKKVSKTPRGMAMRLSKNAKFILAVWVGKAVIALATAGYAAVKNRKRKKQ